MRRALTILGVAAGLFAVMLGVNGCIALTYGVIYR